MKQQRPVCTILMEPRPGNGYHHRCKESVMGSKLTRPAHISTQYQRSREGHSVTGSVPTVLLSKQSPWPRRSSSQLTRTGLFLVSPIRTSLRNLRMCLGWSPTVPSEKHSHRLTPFESVSLFNDFLSTKIRGCQPRLLESSW